MKSKLRIKYWILALLFSVPIIFWLLQTESLFLNLLTVFGFLLGCGLILALIPYKRHRYLIKLYFTIPLSITVFGLYLAIVLLKYEYGVFERFNYFTAKQDIRNDNINIVSYGEIGDVIYIERSLEKKFGFTNIYMGCTIKGNGYKHYNNVMFDYLKEKNGIDWKAKYDFNVDSCYAIFLNETRHRNFDDAKYNKLADSITENIDLLRKLFKKNSLENVCKMWRLIDEPCLQKDNNKSNQFGNR